MGVLFAPLLTRFYEPGTFGIYAVFTSLLSVIAVVSTLRFDLAIPVAKRDSEAATLCGLAIGSALLTALLVACVGLISGKLSPRVPNHSFLYGVLLPLALCGTALTQVASYLGTREKAFSRLSLSRFVTGLFGPSTQAFVGPFHVGIFGLVAGLLCGLSAGVVVFFQTLKHWLVALVRNFSKESVFKVIADYKSFPLFSTWGALLNVLSFHLPLLLVSRSFGAVVTGHLALSTRFIFLPLQLVTSAVGQVFLGNASAALNEGRLGSAVLRLFARLNGAACILVLPLGCLAPEGFQLIFGPDWAPAGRFASYLAPWLAMLVTGSPLSSVSVVTHRQRGEFYFQIALFTSRTAALVVGPRYLGVDATIALFAGASAVLWLYYNVWILNVAGVNMRVVGKIVMTSLLTSLPAVFAAVYLKGLMLDPGLTRVFAVTFFLALLAGLLLVYHQFVKRYAP